MRYSGLVAGFILVVLSGCTVMEIDRVSDDYQAVASRISLGDKKEKVLSILDPIQRELSASARKQSESFLKDGKRIEIYYMRSSRQPDGLTTDDEFTPYVFEDGILVAIGWASLGGPKSQGQTRDSIYIDNSNTTTVY